MKRLAVVWLVCAVTGFLVAAALAVGLALSIDGHGHAPTGANAARIEHSSLGEPPAYETRRQLMAD